MKKRLHLVYVCADRGVPIGGTKGASAHVWELANALACRGAELRLIAARTTDGVDARALAAPVCDLAADRAMRLMRQAVFADAAGARRQAQAAEVYGLLLNQGIARELEQLHRRWRIDAIYERYSLWSYAAAGFARAVGIPYLLEVNAPLREEQLRYRSLDNAAAAATLESYLLRSADHVIVPSAALRPFVVSRGARPAGVRVMPNAADPERFARQDEVTVTHRQDAFTVGFLGTLKPWHGVEDLVRAFRRLHRADAGYRLLIAGNGPLRPVLERMVRGWGLREVTTFTGEVEHTRVPKVLHQMDVAVAPYPRLSGFYFSPLKIFEYMAAGVPVVASDIGQIGELLTHRETALLYRPGVVRELAAQVEALRRRPALAASLARRARQLVRRRFTWERNAERVLDLIIRQIGRRRRRG